MKKKLNIVRYVIISVVFLFVFNFDTKVMAGTTCTYTAEYPFTDDSSITSTQYDYMRYFFKKVLLNDLKDFEETEEYKLTFKGLTIDEAKDEFFNSWVNSPKDYERVQFRLDLNKPILESLRNNLLDQIKLSFELGEKKILSIKFNGPSTIYKSYENYLMDSDSCPDIVIVHPKGCKSVLLSDNCYFGIPTTGFLGKSVDDLLSSLFDLIEHSFDKYSISSVYDNLAEYREYMIIFMSNEAKIASGGIMYVNRAYNLDFNETDADKDVDPVVDKYLALDGFSEGLTQINENIDSYLDGTINSDTYAEMATLISKLVTKIDNLDTIQSDLTLLKNFNSTNVGDISGIRNILNEFVLNYNSSLKSEEWFEQYMPDSKARYVDSLIMVLDWANKNAPTLKRNQELNGFVEENTDCKDAVCLRKFCENKSDIAAQSYCYSSSVTDSDQAARACYNTYKGERFYKVFCENKSDKELVEFFDDLNKMAKEQQDKINNYIEESVYNSIKTPGIEIKKEDKLCEVLYSDKGLGEYIFGLLNVIRIGGPILIIVLTAYDGIKMIASFKDDENKKFYNRLKIRLICLVILFLVPTLIKFLINLLIPEGTCLEYLKNI